MLDQLDDRFAIPGVLEFGRGEGNLPRARITTDLCAGELYLHGAHVTSFRPAGADEVLWVSETARFNPGAAIRGGIPICWPWFGEDPTGAGRPAHGFARNRNFAVTHTELTADGACVVELCLENETETRGLWPFDFRLALTVTFGAALDLRLRMDNHAAQAVAHTAALHTYLLVDDVENVEVAGLTGADYLDKTRGFARYTQGDPPRIQGEVDRVFLQTTAACEVTDPGFGRTVRVRKTGSRTTVLWNPGAERAARLPDLHDYRRMLCVESANAADDEVTLAPGAHHVLGTTLELVR